LARQQAAQLPPSGCARWHDLGVVAEKTARLATDLTDVVVRDTALALGLVDVKVCAVDDIWSGLKFVIPKEQRKGKRSDKVDRRI
jgi:hypothetical protein